MSKNWLFKDRIECNISELEKKRKFETVMSIIFLMESILFFVVTFLYYAAGYITTGIYIFIVGVGAYFLSIDSANTKIDINMWIFLKKKLGE